MTEASTPIRITAQLEYDGKGKKRINILVSPELAEVIEKYALLNGKSKGEIIEEAVKDSFALLNGRSKGAIIEEAVKESFSSAPMGLGRWRLGKR
jgi:hypothetical protein